MPIPLVTQRRLAQIDLMLDMAFGRSVEYWRFPSATELRWSSTCSITKDIFIGARDGLQNGARAYWKWFEDKWARLPPE